MENRIRSIAALGVGGLLIFLPGCGQVDRAPQPGPSASVTQASASSILTPAAPRWEPPLPQVEPGRPPAESGLIEYEWIGVELMVFRLRVLPDGKAIVSQGDIPIAVLELPPERLATLISQFEAADFSELQPSTNTTIPPPTIGVDEPCWAITYARPDPKTLDWCESSAPPPDLLQLERSLIAMRSDVLQHGQRPPPRIIDYTAVSRGDSSGYDMSIDTDGAVHFTGYHAGQMPAAEFQQLVALLKSPAFLELDPPYMPPADQRDLFNKQWAVIQYHDGAIQREVWAESGASVPPVLQSLLQRLADIYTRFYPR